MDMHPLRFVKAHPAGTAVSVVVGYALGKYGIGSLPVIGRLTIKGGASVSDSGDGN